MAKFRCHQCGNENINEFSAEPSDGGMLNGGIWNIKCDKCNYQAEMFAPVGHKASTRQVIEWIESEEQRMITAGELIEQDYARKQRTEALERQQDVVNHPQHYNNGKIECIDAIESAVTGLMGFEAVCTGHVIRYIWRWPHKNGLQDLKKCRYYLDKLINKIESEEK